MISILKYIYRGIHTLIFFCVLSSLFGCDRRLDKNNPFERKKLEENTKFEGFMLSNDMALSEWFAHQSFAIQVISTNDQQKIISYPKFSKLETKAETVIDIQRECMQEFLAYQGKIDKLTKSDQWFDSQLEAEKVLLDFVTNESLLTQEQFKNLSESGDYHIDVLSRQKILLDYIRRKRDLSNELQKQANTIKQEPPSD
jgi:hypothetical protein